MILSISKRRINLFNALACFVREHRHYRAEDINVHNNMTTRYHTIDILPSDLS